MSEPETKPGTSKLKLAVGFCCGAPLLLGLICVVGGYLLPKDFKASTRATINAPPAKVYPYFASAEGVGDWWAATVANLPKGYPPMEVVALDGPTAGKGTRLEFRGGGSVLERWEILEATENQGVVYAVEFAVMELKIERTITLKAAGEATEVVWSESAQLESPMLRWVSLVSPSPEKNFDLALQGLKGLVEAPPK